MPDFLLLIGQVFWVRVNHWFYEIVWLINSHIGTFEFRA
jgi:hypothetical protein